jgi:hypothetical protein
VRRRHLARPWPGGKAVFNPGGDEASDYAAAALPQSRLAMMRASSTGNGRPK